MTDDRLEAVLADLDTESEWLDADQWLDLAQAFAGPPGRGPVSREMI